ncbi:MAG: hypothetical protein WAM81_04990 [Acidimicrobiia bacterium]
MGSKLLLPPGLTPDGYVDSEEVIHVASATTPTNEHSEQCSRAVEIVQEPPVVAHRSDGHGSMESVAGGRLPEGSM